MLFRCSITNLKYWGRSEQIISKTLQLLNDLSVGYSCVRKLVKLEEVQFMLNHHTVSHKYIKAVAAIAWYSTAVPPQF
jgi:exportin-7